VNELLAVMLLAATHGIPVCPHAGARVWVTDIDDPGLGSLSREHAGIRTSALDLNVRSMERGT